MTASPRKTDIASLSAVELALPTGAARCPPSRPPATRSPGPSVSSRQSTPSSAGTRRLRSRKPGRPRRAPGGQALGPLDGVPVTVKDNIAVAGLDQPLAVPRDPARADDEDAPAVARLREGGAVFLGKTTMPEYGWKGVSDSPLSGITRNPWNTGDRTRRLVGRRGGVRGAQRRLHPLGTDGRLDPHPGGLHRRLRHQVDLWPRAGLSRLHHGLPRPCRAADADVEDAAIALRSSASPMPAT